MMDWIEFWNEFPDRFDKKEYLRQVGKTFHGEPVTKDVIETIIGNIQKKLQLTPQDIVLDLCCGNGLLTSKIAKSCEEVVGIDYSGQLIKVAKEHFSQSNVTYHTLSVMDITADVINKKPFTKIYMYEALQHFSEGQLSPLLDSLIDVSNDTAIMFFASIPDVNRLWSFYNTPELKQQYYEQKEKGALLLGTWWDKNFIKNICTEKNLICEFVDQPNGLYTSHYRFDVVIKKKQ